MAVTIGQWRWYTDAADGSMVALAAENTAPTLTGDQIQSGIVRLRVQLVGDASGGSVTLNAQHGVDGTNWKSWGTTLGGNEWIRWGNGAATASATLTSTKLTGSTASGKYHEAGAVVETVAASSTLEVDLAAFLAWPAPSCTVIVRLLSTSTALGFAGGVPAITFTTPAPSGRKFTVDTAGTSTSGGQVREVDFSCWPRMWNDGTYWWFFAPQPSIASTALSYWRWDGTGGEYQTWNKSTVTPSTGVSVVVTAEGDVRHAFNFATVGSSKIVVAAVRPASGNLRWLRGESSAGSITWTNVDLGRATYATTGYPIHGCVDDGGWHWVGGFNSTTGVWACRSTSADTGGSFTPSFGTLDTNRLTLADTITVDPGGQGNPITFLSLASNKVLAVWLSGTNLRWATVTSSGWSAAATVNPTPIIGSHEWSMARSDDGNVYLAYRDTTGGSGANGGEWCLMVYSISGNAWTQAANAPRQTQVSNADGLIVSTAPNSRVYVFGTGVGPGGNQDRPIQMVAYTGPGSGGTWDTTYTLITPVSRGNGDDIAGTQAAGADGRIMVGYLWGDNDVAGHPFTYESHQVQAFDPAPPPAAELTITGRRVYT